MTLRTLNYGNYGIFLIMGSAGFCPSDPQGHKPLAASIIPVGTLVSPSLSEAGAQTDSEQNPKGHNNSVLVAVLGSVNQGPGHLRNEQASNLKA